MKYRDFGKTGIKVSEVGFGAWAIGGNAHGNSYGPTNDEESFDAIHRAIAMGCNFFDTADVYGWGHSEELLAKALKGRRDLAVIATKGGSDFYQGFGYQTFTNEYVRFALEKSLERLKTDYIDLYQLHNPPEEVIKNESTYEVLYRLKEEGKIRAWGLSVLSMKEALTALTIAKPDSLQVPYNVFIQEPSEVFARAVETGCAIIAREPLANGFLTGKYDNESKFVTGDVRKNWPRDYINARIAAVRQLKFLEVPCERTLAQSALQWVLLAPAVAVTIPGIKTLDQAEENLLAPDVLPLSENELVTVRNLQDTKFGLTG